MTDKTKRIILIVNTVLCVIAIPVSFGVMTASVMGGAAAAGTEKELGTIIALLGMWCWIPAPLSIIGSWLTRKRTNVAMAFVALPWVYFLVLGIFLAVLFSQPS